MPQFQVKSPDGKTYNVNAPDGSTQEDAIAYVQNGMQAPAPTPDAKPAGFDSSAVRYGMNAIDNGLPFVGSFSDEITSGLGALIGSAYTQVAPGVTPQSVGEVYDTARQQAQQRLAYEQKNDPGVSLATTLGGGILSGAAALRTAPGAALASRVGGGLLPEATSFGGRAANLASKAALSGTSGAATGALYGAGTGEGGERLENAGQGALYGLFAAGVPVVSAGAGKAGQAIGGLFGDVKSGLGALTDDGLKASKGQLTDLTSNRYETMREIGAVYGPEKADSIANQVAAAVGKVGGLDDELHGPILRRIQKLKEVAASPNGVDLETFDQQRQLMGEVVETAQRAGNGGLAKRAKEAIKALDGALDNVDQADLVGGSKEAVDALRQGRAAASASYRLQDVQRIVDSANGDANKLKNGLQKLADKLKDNSRGWSPDEISALNNAARSSTTDGVLKAFGKFGFDLGSSRNAGNTALPALLAAGGIAGLPGGLPLAAIGTVARSASKAAARGKTQELVNQITNRGLRMGGAQLPPTIDLTQLPRFGAKMPPGVTQEDLNLLFSNQRVNQGLFGGNN